MPTGSEIASSAAISSRAARVLDGIQVGRHHLKGVVDLRLELPFEVIDLGTYQAASYKHPDEQLTDGAAPVVGANSRTTR